MATSLNIEKLIESIGLPAAELRAYLIDEIDEFLAASDPAHLEDEFGDVLFALLSMAWAHTGRHYPLRLDLAEAKLQQRLGRYGTISRHAPKYTDDRIAEMEVGVVHFVLGQFGGQWQRFDALQNGTVAEISALTDAPFGEPDRLTNHCIVTFGDVDEISYEIIYSAATQRAGNTIRCRIPDFLFLRAKKGLIFDQLAGLMALQVSAALDGIRLSPSAIAHFHSWESGFLTDSVSFWRRIAAMKTIFSPYLTTGRLKALIESRGGTGWTMTPDELRVAADYERKLSQACMRVVLESSLDREFFTSWVHPERLDLRSFAVDRQASFAVEPPRAGRLTFIAGGRPVREKGFVELCREFAAVRDWAKDEGVEVSLTILCRERNRSKGQEYIVDIERVIAEKNLGDCISIEPKVSLDELKQRIRESDALIVPSIYDPYCLMPTYSVEEKRPSFVSTHAGIAENIRSPEFTFDPELEGDLVRAIRAWYAKPSVFAFESRFASYLGLYLAKESRPLWE